MNFFKKTFFMCFTLTAITILLSFIPKQIIRKIHGYCMGFTTGTMSAILFASLIPELLANAGTTNYQNNDSWSTKFEVKKHKINQILSILIFLGIFLGWFLEVLVHTLIPKKSLKKNKSVTVDIWFYTICNCLHNITDGILIGIQKKWEIVFALATHEIPFSLGSLSYYVNKGVSKRNSTVLLLIQKSGFFLGNSIGLIANKENSEKLNDYTIAIIKIRLSMIVDDKKDATKRITSFFVSNLFTSVILYKTHPSH